MIRNTEVKVARYEVTSLRLDVATSERVARLAVLLGVPRTVLMRRMVEGVTGALVGLIEEEDGDAS